MAADAAAQAQGLRPGMALAEATALVPGLAVAPADPAADAAGLARLAGWCLRYAPLAAPDAPDGLWIDITGAAHLAGGETALLAALRGRLGGAGIAARIAVADTPGAAWALARFGATKEVVALPGEAAAVLAPLPPAALRLDAGAVALLDRLGITRIAELCALPRGPLTRRFGAAVLGRLDQALGRAPEPIIPVVPPAALVARCEFAEPLLTAEALGGAIDLLVARICSKLEAAGAGARRLDLRFERVDGAVPTTRIGTAQATRAPAHLVRLLRARLETVDPGLGVAALSLVAARAEPLAAVQATAALAGAPAAEPDPVDLAALVDRLANRLGAGRVWRAAPVESEVPERMVRRIAPLAPPVGQGWPGGRPRPSRLLWP
ncbi:MAG: Y-family DNA polymerase, partial [Acetobacteraceae bacterium]